MSEKPFRFALLVGRFQMLHLGHVDMIRKALECADRVGILIGSSQESGTRTNPFSYELRAEILKKVFGEQILVAPLPDIHVGNVPRWGEYVLDTAEHAFKVTPDLFVSGKEGRRESWFSGENGRTMAELTVPKTIEISASELRELLTLGKRKEWRTYVDPKLWPLYPRLREAVLLSRDETETDSI